MRALFDDKINANLAKELNGEYATVGTQRELAQRLQRLT
jgi:hypothetical protein